MPGEPRWALDDEIITIRPQPASSMSVTATWQQWKVPVRFTSMSRCQDCTLISVNGDQPTAPALVTRMCTGPSSVRTFANASSTAARSLTSAATPSAVTPSRAQFLCDPLRRLAVEVEHGHLVSTPAELVAGRLTHAGSAPCHYRDAGHPSRPITRPRFYS